MKSVLPSGPFINLHHEFSKKFDFLHGMICEELSQPDLGILRRHEFISGLQMLLKSPEASEYTPPNYYWHTRIDDLLSVYSLHVEILSEEDDDDDEGNADENLSAKDDLFDFWINSELDQPFQEKIKTLSLLESSEFVLALFEQNLLGFFHLQISRSPNVIDSLIYPITIEVGDSPKQIYLSSRDKLISFDTPSETFPVVVIKDFLPTANKVSYLDKGKWYSAEIVPSTYSSSEICPIKVIHHGQLSANQYAEALANINKALGLIQSTDENIFNLVCVFTSHLCINTNPIIASNTTNPMPGMSFIPLDNSDRVSLAVKILQASALHFFNISLVLNDFVIDDNENIYFDLELNKECSVLDILRNIQISYWPLVFLLKIIDTSSNSKAIEFGIDKLLEFHFLALVYEDYIEHAFQTYKITQAGKDFCEKFINTVKDASTKIQALETFVLNKSPEHYKKLQLQLDNWRKIKKEHSLNH